MIPEHIKSQFAALEKFGINTKLRLAHFLAQASHESMNFTRTVENLKYSNVNRIALIFKNDVDVDKDKVVELHEIEFAKKFVNNPVALANFVYANQNGNGDEASGDGWKHRGAGYIQLTGKKNQQDFFKFIGLPIDSDPLLISTTYALQSAAWFFNTRKLNEIADTGTDKSVVKAITLKVNGGLHGLDERTKLFKDYFAELN